MSKTKAFFQKYKGDAIRATAGSKIFPEVVLAAAALESRNGESLLTSKFNKAIQFLKTNLMSKKKKQNANSPS